MQLGIYDYAWRGPPSIFALLRRASYEFAPRQAQARVERIRDHLLPLYRRYGRAEDCRIELFDRGHEETPEMRKLVDAWLDEHLVAAR